MTFETYQSAIEKETFESLNLLCMYTLYEPDETPEGTEN